MNKSIALIIACASLVVAVSACNEAVEYSECRATPGMQVCIGNTVMKCEDGFFGDRQNV